MFGWRLSEYFSYFHLSPPNSQVHIRNTEIQKKAKKSMMFGIITNNKQRDVNTMCKKNLQKRQRQRNCSFYFSIDICRRLTGWHNIAVWWHCELHSAHWLSSTSMTCLDCYYRRFSELGITRNSMWRWGRGITCWVTFSLLVLTLRRGQTMTKIDIT